MRLEPAVNLHPPARTALPSLPVAGPFFSTPAQRTQLARERFFEQGRRPTGIVGEEVIQSWTRCLGAGLQPHQRPEFEPVTRARTKAVLERGHPLLQSAVPELDQLDGMLAGTACKTLLTDREGIVLRATPAGAGAGELLDTIGRVGVFLGEANFGSTAPGISVNTGRDCGVAGAEHFFGVLQSLYCAAAPVRDRQGRVVGVLDVSVQGAPFAFDALALVRLCVAGIENRLLAAQSADELVLCLQASPALLGTPLEGRVAVAEDGRIVGVNAAASRLLQAPDEGRGLDVEGLLGLTLAQLQRLRGTTVPQPHRLPSGLRLWLVLGGGEAPAAPAVASAASLRAVNDQLIADTLRQCEGNLALAARTLGVSRGLLYRRLRRASPPD